MASGLLDPCPAIHIKRGGLKVAQWSGKVRYQQQTVPGHLDWDMYCGPAPLRPYQPHRFGGTHRGYWDYEGGGLVDMAQHHFDPVNWVYAKDDTSPVEIEAYAPPAHPEACGMWGWIELRYADGLTIVMDSGEWGEPYDRRQPREVSLSDLSEQNQKKVLEMPDPQLVSFADAVKTRQQTGGHPEAAHRTATLLHLANIAIRTGRNIHYDPVAEQVIGDEEARKELSDALAAALLSDRSNHVKSFLCQELQWAGGEEAVLLLGQLLLDEELVEPATMALLAIHQGAAEQFRTALPNARGKCRLNIIQALGDVKDLESIDSLKSALRDPDREVRLAAGWGLARMGDAGSVELLINEADTRTGWERIQATKHCLVLAEQLSPVGKKEMAERIYIHLRDTRTDAAEQYIREAAERALRTG